MKSSKAHGFTLIEVLIVMVIMSFLGYFTAQSLRSSIQFKSRFQTDIDQQAVLESTIQLMERDISLAFHHRDVIGDLYRQAKSEMNATPTPPQTNPAFGQPPTPPQSANPADPNAQPIKQQTQFLGEESKLVFTSRANIRTQLNSPESDQAVIAYELRSCPQNQAEVETKEGKTYQCLYRRLTPYLSDDISKGPQEDDQLLLRDVVNFKLKYYGDGKQDAVTSWFTDTRGDDVTRDNFPLAVEVTLTTDMQGRSREATLSTLIALRFPNNPPKKKTAVTP